MNIAPPGYGHLGSMGDKEGAILMETMYILAAKTSNKRPYSGAPPAPPPHPALQAPLNLLPILPTIAAEHMQQLCNQASIPALSVSLPIHLPLARTAQALIVHSKVCMSPLLLWAAVCTSM
eukprot:1157593-Pelagomonas_calceolata.AAC.1